MSHAHPALSDFLADAYKQACLAELAALKPGNVHIFADGHRMVVQDFVASAEASAVVIAAPDLSVGERILNAINATWDAVNCNTNLGIVLLASPMIQAVYNSEEPLTQQMLKQVLASLTVEDAGLAYKAILRATPAGLGESKQHDVHETPAVSLLTAMQEAADRDMVARQYACVYDDIFAFGIPLYESLLAQWEREAWAVTAVHLGFMAQYPDSHIVRKFGMETAQAVQVEAAAHVQAFTAQDNPKVYQRTLMDFDKSLKSRGINPGTSADLTVTTLLAKTLRQPDSNFSSKPAV